MANVTEARWTDDAQAESVLKSRKVAWKSQVVSVADIDFEASRANRGRIDTKLDDDRVYEYAVALLDGNAFPKPVLNLRDGSKHYILSGNHRCRGVREAKFEELEAYVVRIEDEMLMDLLPMLFNVHHGINVPLEAKYEQAKYMVDTYGVDMKQAAQDYKIGYDAFRTYLRGLCAVDRLSTVGIDGAKLTRAIQVKLNGVENLNTFTALGQLLTRHKLDTERAISLIDEARDAETELESLQVIARVNDQLVQERRSRDADTVVPLPVRDRFFRQLNGLLNMLIKHQTAKACQITNPTDLRAVNDKIATIVTRATALFGYPGEQPAAEPTAAGEAPRVQDGVPSGRGAPARGRSTRHVR